MANLIKDKEERELTRELAAKREELRVFRFDSSGSKIRDVKHGKGLRKEIARIMTEMSRRRLSSNK